MDDSCEHIVRKEGVGWLFEKTVPPKGSLVRGALGVRDEGVQDIHVYASNGTSAVVIPNAPSFSNIGAGSVSMGLFLNLPTGSDNGEIHIVLNVRNRLELYEQNGDLYFRVKRSGEDWVTISTNGSGINYCDGVTKYIRVYRDSHDQNNLLGLSVYGGDTFEVPITTGYDLTFGTDLVLGARDEGNIYGYFLAAGTMLSGFYLVRDILKKSDNVLFWSDGVPLVGSQLFLKLDENSTDVIYDSGGYGNHGSVHGFTPVCRGVHGNFFSWQNHYGFSTDGDVLVPSLMTSTEIDINGGPLEFAGRVRMSARIIDILCLQANGVAWGRVQNPIRLQLRPGQDTFSILGVFEKSPESTGILMSVGDRYSLSWVSGSLRVSFGGQVSDIPVNDGDHMYMLNVSLLACDVWIDNVLVDTVPVGSTFSGGGDADMLGDNGVNILDGGTVTFLGVRTYMTETEKDNWFSSVILEGDFYGAYYFYSNTDFVFDISCYVNHIEMYGYTSDIWSGRQSIMPYLAGGYTEVYSDSQNLLYPVVIPFDIKGQKIIWDIYGPSQLEVEYYRNGGLLIFDAYVDFNPEKKVLGFWTDFWDKSNTTFWNSLDGSFYTDNVHKWNIQELNMDYFLQSLDENAYNYVFTGSSTGDYGFTTEVVDLILFNLGNNIIYKSIPL